MNTLTLKDNKLALSLFICLGILIGFSSSNPLFIAGLGAAGLGLIFIMFKETRVYIPVFIVISFIFSGVEDVRLTGVYNFYIMGKYVFTTDLILLFGFGFFCLDSFISPKKWMFSDINLIIYVFLGFWLIALIRGYSYEGVIPFWDAKRIIPILIYFLTVNTIISRKRLKRLVWVIYAGITGVIGSGYLTLFVKGYHPVYQGFITGTGATQAFLLVLTSSLSLCLAAYTSVGIKYRWWLYTIIFLSGILIYFSYSRTCMVQFLIVLFLLLCILPLKRNRSFILSLFIFGLLFILFYNQSNIIKSFVGTTYLRIKQISLSSSGAISHILMAKEAISSMLAHPLLGLGFGPKITFYLPIYKKTFSFTSPHNDFLYLGWKCGIPSALLYYSTNLLAIKKGLSLFKFQKDSFLKALSLAFSIYLLSCVVASMVFPIFQHPFVMISLWLSIGVIVVIEKTTRKS